MSSVAAVTTPSGVSRACNTARPRQQLNSIAVQHAACSRVQRRLQRAVVATAAAAAPAANGAAASNGNGASSSDSGRTAPSSAETARTIVDLVAHGTLCTLGEDGVPLGTYVSYVLDASVRRHKPASLSAFWLLRLAAVLREHGSCLLHLLPRQSAHGGVRRLLPAQRWPAGHPSTPSFHTALPRPPTHAQGQPILRLRADAVHTANLKRDAKCSLFVQPGEHPARLLARVTLIGAVEPVSAGGARQPRPARRCQGCYLWRQAVS